MTNIVTKSLNIDIDSDIDTKNIFNSKNEQIEKLLKEIKEIVFSFCLQKNINIKKQEYMISGRIENIDILGSWYSLCTNEYFNFFGKYYFDHNYEAIDIFKNDKEIYNHTIKNNDLVVCINHFYNQTLSKSEKKYLEFYVAPKKFLCHFDLTKWTSL